MEANNSEHLIPKTTSRGFIHLPAIQSTYQDAEVRVYESSAALGPHIWLSAEEPGKDDRYIAVHLTLEDAAKLAEQIMYLVKNHYQVQDRSEQKQVQMQEQAPAGGGAIEKLWRVAFDYHGRPASWWTSRDYEDALARLNEARVEHQERALWPNLRLEVRESIHGPWLPVEGV